MPFIKVIETDTVNPKPTGELYINSDLVQHVRIDPNHITAVSTPDFRYHITEESARYFLSEVDTRDAGVSASDIPKRSLSSRIASMLRDDCPTGASLKDLYVAFPDETPQAITKASSILFSERVITVLDDGTLIHNTHKHEPEPTFTLDQPVPESTIITGLRYVLNKLRKRSTPNPDPSIAAAAPGLPLDRPDDTAR